MPVNEPPSSDILIMPFAGAVILNCRVANASRVATRDESFSESLMHTAIETSRFNKGHKYLQFDQIILFIYSNNLLQTGLFINAEQIIKLQARQA